MFGQLTHLATILGNAELLEANGTVVRDAALLMLEQVADIHRVTAGGDNGCDTTAS